MPERVYGIIDWLSRHRYPTADGKRIPYACFLRLGFLPGDSRMIPGAGFGCAKGRCEAA